ncbi:putative virion structural protein [Salmonella phage SPAsTU]|nr:putative virion structural protein [Salmonella phage SPAsTU]
MSELVYDFTTGCYREVGVKVAVESFGRDPFFDDGEYSTGMYYDYGFGGYVPMGLVVAHEAMKNDSLRKAFEGAFKKVVIDRRLASKLRHYVNGVLSREGNVEWLGSNLLGVHSIRFYDSDRNRLFDEVLMVDEDYLAEIIKETNTINTDWAVAGDTYNLAMVFLLHLMMPKFSDKEIKAAAVDCVTLLQFKFYSSIYYHFFPKPVDMPAAEATYSMLSLKFDIRRLGNWGLHMQERSEYFCSTEYPNYDAVKRFDTPDLVLRFITDLNTRTKQTVKDYYGVLDKVRRDNSRVVTQSTRIELDGESIIRDKVGALDIAKQNLFDASYDLNNLYKEQLAKVVLELVPKASPAALKTLLQYIASLPLGKKRDEINSIMEDTLSHAFDEIVTSRLNFNDAVVVLQRMRALYQASKSPNPYVLSLRQRIEKLAARETHIRHESALAALRNALLLYFLIRSLQK